MFCIHCGCELPEHAKFCLNCGQSVSETATPPEAKGVDPSDNAVPRPSGQPNYTATQNSYSPDPRPVNQQNPAYTSAQPYSQPTSSSSAGYNTPQYGYGYSAPQTPYTAPKNSSPYRKPSIVLGIIGLCFCCITIFLWPLGIIGAAMCILSLVFSKKAGKPFVPSIIGLILAGIGLILAALILSTPTSNNSTTEVDTYDSYIEEKAETSENDNTDDDNSVQTIVETPAPAEQQDPEPADDDSESESIPDTNGIELASDTTNMALGEIAATGSSSNSLYIGLACVRTTTSPKTAVDTAADLASGDEALFAFLEIYNPTNDVKSFSSWGISAYADGTQVSDLNSTFLMSCDGVEAMNGYTVDPGMKMVVLLDFEVPQGWSEFTLFYDSDCSWTISSADVSSVPYDSSSSLYNVSNDYTLTQVGDIIYSDSEKEITYSGFTTWSYDSMFDGIKQFVVFEFQIDNIGSDELGYSLVGYNMRCYQNGVLLDDADYIYADQPIDGYTNIFDIDSIQPGMSAKIFVAFEVDSIADGEYILSYDEGYIFDNPLATVCVHYPNLITT